MNSDPLFILAGNGSYGNRGCEAIVRGTTKIIRKYFKNPHFLCYSTFENPEQFKNQIIEETDDKIVHKKIPIPGKKLNYSFNILRKLGIPNLKSFYEYRNFQNDLPNSEVVLSVGGDTYALDWGIPKLYTDLDDIVLKNKKPLIIWGASIGPFDSNPDYERYMLNHLKKVQGLFIRENKTIQYLEKNNIKNNVYPVADPAFVMDPVKPVANKLDLKINPNTIGINLSTIMGNFTTNGNFEQWLQLASKIIINLSKETEFDIYLIPHVVRPVPMDNDYIFLKNILSNLPKNIDNIKIIPPTLTAAELKWVISQMSVFMGSRMHSNIAALSSCVPTLSIAYSVKAKGITEDIFNSNQYWINPDQITTEIITQKIKFLIENSEDIKTSLNNKIPEIQKHAMNAGQYLKDILDRS
jgi:polysaccharide pyruvyl transferase WcaK-like protein